MMLRRGLLLVLAAGIVLGAGAAPAQDKDKPNPTGTWKWTTEFGGQKRDNTLKLKLDGDKLTGAWVDREGKDVPIEDAKYKDGEVTFKVTRERDGQKFTIKYQGKVSGDTLKGKTELDFGGETQSRDWEAKREKK